MGERGGGEGRGERGGGRGEGGECEGQRRKEYCITASNYTA